MSKKRIIMMAAAGLVSFVGAFAFAWLTKTTGLRDGVEVEQPTLAGEGTELQLPQPESGAISEVEYSKMKKAMTEKQLKNLVYDVREQLREYESKLQDLGVREQRLQIAHSTIKKDLEELNNLRIELASMVAGLKSERDKLLKSRVKIAKSEKANLMTIAAAYDKMDSASASKILTNISQIKSSRGDSSSFDDALKILHYMGERTKAKLLAELVISEPKLAAVLCQRLKHIVEEE